jgi:ankyrin repeat protein
METLFISNPLDDKATIESRKDELFEETYDWILKDGVFTEWLNNDANSVIWLHGDPGKGKTMLSIALIDELSLKVSITPNDPDILAYFFCDRQDGRRGSCLSILRGLLYQVLCQYPQLVQQLIFATRTNISSVLSSVNAEQAIWRLFVWTMRNIPSQTAYFVVDGLDECDASSKWFLGFLKRTQDFGCKMKWILSSRNEFSIQQHLPQHREISLEANFAVVEKAVLDYINVKVDRLAAQKRYPEELRNFVEERLKESAHGTFLWVALACRELGATSVRSITTKKVLAELPASLALIYERMLEQVLGNPDPELREFALDILRCVATAMRPLTLREVAIAANLPDEYQGDDQLLREYTDQCGSFLTIRDDQSNGIQTVYFVHESAQEFLTRPPSDSLLGLDVLAQHRKMGILCLDILSRDPAIGTFKYEILAEENNEVLSEYATTFWMQHARLAGEIFTDVVESHPFFSEYSPARRLWMSRFRSSFELHTPFTRLQLGAYAGIIPLVEKALKWLDANPNKENRERALVYAVAESHEDVVTLLLSKGIKLEVESLLATQIPFSPLHMAMHRRQDGISEKLIKSGMNVNVIVKDGYGTALQLAAAVGNLGLAQLLLDCGANVLTNGGRFGSAFHLAGRAGHTKMSHLLLKRMKNKSVPPASLIPALLDAVQKGDVELTRDLIENGVLLGPKMDIAMVVRVAAASRHPECLKLLLESGAPAWSQWDDYKPAMLAASESGDLESVQLLLDHGASPNVETAWVFNAVHTPLLAAASSDHEEVVEVLLANGASPACIDSAGSTPLLQAASTGNARIVNMLLDNGADINKKNLAGRNATEIALMRKHRVVFHHLIENGGTYDEKWAALHHSEALKMIMGPEDQDFMETGYETDHSRFEDYEPSSALDIEFSGYETEPVSDDADEDFPDL